MPPSPVVVVSSASMDSNTSSYLLNHTTLSQVYYQGKEGNSIIDLGLSLRTLQPEAYHQAGHGNADDYDLLMDWQQLHPQLKSSKIEYSQNIAENYEDEAEGIQSKERWTYVKVNMDGIIVGRKICILDQMGYSTLALQLEEMFGKHSISGLRLFQAESEFTLLYKDRDEQWRTVGDCSWKAIADYLFKQKLLITLPIIANRKFVERVKRLRIIPKDETLVPSSSALFNSL